MKKLSKIKSLSFIFLFVVAFIIGLTTTQAWSRNFTNYYGVEMTREEYNTLLDLGFSDYEINYMEQRIFDENKNLDSKLLAKTTKYYKTIYPTYGNGYTIEVTEDEYNHHDNNFRGYVETLYHSINSTISANGSLYRYKVTMLWNSFPPNTSYDVIGIGFDDDVYIDSVATFYYMYTTSDNHTYTSYNYFNRMHTDFGGTATYDVPDNFIGGGTVYYFDVDKEDYAGTITSLSMCGDYAHAHATVTGAQAASHSIGRLGIDFASSVYGYFDAIPCADAYITGISW